MRQAVYVKRRAKANKQTNNLKKGEQIMKTTTKEMCNLINLLSELRETKCVLVPISMIEKIVELGSVFGMNIMGGALTDSCDAQYLYID